MINIILMAFILQNVFLLNVILLKVYFAECHSDENCCGEFYSTDTHYSQCHSLALILPNVSLLNVILLKVYSSECRPVQTSFCWMSSQRHSLALILPNVFLLNVILLKVYSSECHSAECLITGKVIFLLKTDIADKVVTKLSIFCIPRLVGQSSSQPARKLGTLDEWISIVAFSIKPFKLLPIPLFWQHQWLVL